VRNSRVFNNSAKLIFGILAIAARGAACVVIYPTVQVGPNFRVKVEDRGRAVEGLRIELSSEHPAFVRTDAKGLAFFRGIRPGLYSLTADHDVGIPAGVDVRVKRNGPTLVTVLLQWPGIPPVPALSLSGWIRGPDYLPGQSQPALSLELLEGSSGRSLKSLDTTADGTFDFGNVAPGLYFVSLKPSALYGWDGSPITGLIAVSADPNASAHQLEIDLGWSSCGLWYASQTACEHADLRIERLAGQVLDSDGAPISKADVFLFDSDGTEVERLQSDSRGKFLSPQSLRGTYQLLVRAPGFTSLHGMLRAEPTGNVTHRLALTVNLGVLGNCSAASNENH
jgi:hypothetical protein